jgi:hypothetical protein
MLFAGPVLVISAAVTPSWAFNASPDGPSGGAGFQVSFYPGSSLVESCSGDCSSGSSLSVSYDSWGLNQTAALYESYQGVWAAAGILGLLSAVLAVLALRRLPSRPISGRAPRGVAFLTAGVVLIALVVLVAVQPATLAADVGGSSAAHWTLDSPSPAGSFFGSCTALPSAPSGTCASGESDAWGPALGFYLALVGAALSLVGGLLFAAARRSLRSPPRGPYRPVSLTGGTEGTRTAGSLSPVPAPLQPPPETVATTKPEPPSQEKCPRCGWYTPWPAAYCRACGAPLLRR